MCIFAFTTELVKEIDKEMDRIKDMDCYKYRVYNDLFDIKTLKILTIVCLYFENGVLVDNVLIGNLYKPKDKILKKIKEFSSFPVSTGKFKITLYFDCSKGIDYFHFEDIEPITEMPSNEAIKEYIRENKFYTMYKYLDSYDKPFKVIVNREDENGNMVSEYIVVDKEGITKEIYPIAKHNPVKRTNTNTIKEVTDWFTSRDSYRNLNISFDDEGVFVTGIYNGNSFYLTILNKDYDIWKKDKEKYFEDNHSNKKEIDDQKSREESMLKRLEFLDKYMYLM